MAATKVRILMVGEESAAVQTLKAIRSAPASHEIVAVMTADEIDVKNASLANVATQIGVPVWPSKLVKNPDFARLVKAEQVDLILNVHSRYIVHEKVLRAPRIGAFNMHPGPLPEYAGLNCVSWALYRGESHYAVTVHWMAPKIDAGNIAYQAAFAIEEKDTPLSLTHKCVKAGVPLLERLVETAGSAPETIPSLPQDLSRREYFSKDIPDGGKLLWNRRAGEIVNFVRACDYTPFPSPWGLPTVFWEHGEMNVVKADRTHQKCDGAPGTVGECGESGALVASADEWVSVRELKIDGQYVKPQAVLKTGLLLHDGI